MTWQGGGGYGDPLSREPEAVAHDLREQKITPLAARSVYGVVVIDGGVDAAATAEEREQLRAARRDRSRAPMEQPGGRADLASSRRIDDNLVEHPVRTAPRSWPADTAPPCSAPPEPTWSWRWQCTTAHRPRQARRSRRTRPTTSTHPWC
jgi:hypothetical protein